MISACLARWPDMARYADTARMERLHHARGWCWCVTVTVFEYEAEQKGQEQ